MTLVYAKRFALVPALRGDKGEDATYLINAYSGFLMKQETMNSITTVFEHPGEAPRLYDAFTIIQANRCSTIEIINMPVKTMNHVTSKFTPLSSIFFIASVPDAPDPDAIVMGISRADVKFYQGKLDALVPGASFNSVLSFVEPGKIGELMRNEAIFTGFCAIVVKGPNNTVVEEFTLGDMVEQGGDFTFVCDCVREYLLD
jgi:hypothetical protein